MDPNAEVCPDFLLPEHDQKRLLLTIGTTTNGEASDLLKSLWTATNDQDKLTWQQQELTDAADLLLRQQQRETDSIAREELETLEHDAAAKEERKRNRNKYLPIPLDRGVPMQAQDVLATYALRKLEKGEYVELWFLTNDGLDSARRSNLHHNQNTMVVTSNADGTTSWEPAVQAPRGVVDDEDLPWEDFCTACPLLIKAAEDALWPIERVDMMSGLFYAVQTHHWRCSRCHVERRSLLVYAGEQRRLWHSIIARGSGAGYNLSIFNDGLLKTTYDRLYRIDQKVQDAAARLPNP